MGRFFHGSLMGEKSTVNDLADECFDTVVLCCRSIQQLFQFNAVTKPYWSTRTVHNQSFRQVSCELPLVFDKQSLELDDVPKRLAAGHGPGTVYWL